MPLNFSDPSTTIGGVPCFEEDVEEEFTTDKSSRATRTLVCAWSDRIALVNYFLGNGLTNVGGTLVYAGPQTYPDAASLIAKAVRPEGVGARSVGSGGMVAYQWARLKVEYGIQEPGTGGGDDAGNLSLDYAGDMLSLPSDDATFKWSDNSEDVPPEANPSLPVTTVEMSKLRKGLPSIPTAMILSLTDKTNNASFEGGDPGTVLFVGASTTTKYATAAQAAGPLDSSSLRWDLTLKFKYRRSGWNNFIRPGDGYKAVVRKDNGEPPFPQANIHALLS